MAIKMRKAAMQLTFREGKPTVFKLRQLVYPAIKHKNLIKYISFLSLCHFWGKIYMF